MSKKSGVYFNEIELRSMLIPSDEINGNIYMPNEIFNDLLTCEHFYPKKSRVKNKDGIVKSYDKNANVNHIAFAFSFLFLASYMYRYARFTYYKNYQEEIFIDEKIMYMILNTSPTSRGKEGVSYITKKGGVLEKLGYTRKESDYPVRFYYVDFDFSFVDFIMFSEIKEELPSDYKKPKARKINYPVRAFHYDEKSDNEHNGYFYDTHNTTGININVFIYCMSRNELGTVGFYLYSFLKSKCDYFRNKNKYAHYTRSIVDLERETGIGSTKLCEMLKNLERHNMITQLSHLENQCKTNCRAGLRSVE